jgi:hypothetical protein
MNSKKLAINVILLFIDTAEQGNVGIFYQCEMSDDNGDCNELEDMNFVILI